MGAMDCRIQRRSFIESTHPCKKKRRKDQSGELADRESLADQQRQRRIMSGMSGGYWEKRREGRSDLKVLENGGLRALSEDKRVGEP